MASPESVLITGCSDGGIGSALAIAFQARGLRVFATARNTSKMAALSSLSNVILLTLDVTNSVQIAAAVKVVEGETGGVLDYLVNNAGRNHFMPMMDENAEIAKAIFDTNVWGSLAVTQAFIPLLIKAKGTVVHNTSISGYVNVPWMGDDDSYYPLLGKLTDERKSRILCCIEALNGNHERHNARRTCTIRCKGPGSRHKLGEDGRTDILRQLQTSRGFAVQVYRSNYQGQSQWSRAPEADDCDRFCRCSRPDHYCGQQEQNLAGVDC